MAKKRVFAIILVAIFLVLFLGCPGDEDGAGSYDCPKCLGRGTLTLKTCCSSCGGGGSAWVWTDHTHKHREWIKCPSCDGTGGWGEEVNKCPGCDGKGTLPYKE